VSGKLPRRLGPYVLLKALGEGAVGTAYLARRFEEPAVCVVKCLHPWHIESPDRTKRFRHEALIAVSVDSPHVVKVLDVGAVGGTPYLAMEYVAGWTVAELLSAFGALGEKPSVPGVLELALDGLRGLGALHDAINPETGTELGVVHRDISPRNLMLHRDGRLLVIDLGLGRSNAQEWRTRAGALMGTPGYMAPEQAASDRVDHRTDLYSFAVVIYELLVLQPYIERGDRPAMIARMQAPIFRPPSELRPGMPPALDEILRRALSIRAEDRFASAGELAREIAALGLTGRREETSTMSLPKSLFDALGRRDREVAALLAIDFEGRPESELEQTIVIARRNPGARALALPEAIRERAPTLHEGKDTLEATAVGEARTLSITETRDDTIRKHVSEILRAATSASKPRWFVGVVTVAAAAGLLALDATHGPVRGPEPSISAAGADQAAPRAAPRVERAAKPETEAPRAAVAAEPSPSLRSIKARRATLPANAPPIAHEEETSRAALEHGYQSLIKDASDLRRSNPSLARDLDRILYDASIWSRSSDAADAENELRSLRARLDALLR
jgi:serine/threonine protein kinase